MFLVLFSQLNLGEQIAKCTLPYGVFSTKNPDDETSEQFQYRQKKFLLLTENIKNKLVSNETSQKIQQIGKSFNLELLQLADIARAIRSYYFGELRLEDFPAYFAKEIPVDMATAQAITKMVIEKIINDDSIEKAYQANLEKLLLSDAMKMYPEFGEQLITTERIKILSFPEPARPSIKNWIADYTAALGYDKHDSVARADYLFHSNNTTRLNSGDRAKLSYILKAFDEKSQVAVDKTSRKIVFSDNNSAEEIRQTNQIPNSKIQTPNKFQNPNSNIQNSIEAPVHRISFSSPQKLAYERKNVPQDQPYRITPAVQTRPQPVENKPDPRTLGKNVVNLRDV